MLNFNYEEATVNEIKQHLLQNNHNNNNNNIQNGCFYNSNATLNNSNNSSSTEKELETKSTVTRSKSMNGGNSARSIGGKGKERSIACSFGCGRHYSSENSLKNHIRLKHSVKMEGRQNAQSNNTSTDIKNNSNNMAALFDFDLSNDQLTQDYQNSHRLPWPIASSSAKVRHRQSLPSASFILKTSKRINPLQLPTQSYSAPLDLLHIVDNTNANNNSVDNNNNANNNNVNNNNVNNNNVSNNNVNNNNVNNNIIYNSNAITNIIYSSIDKNNNNFNSNLNNINIDINSNQQSMQPLQRRHSHPLPIASFSNLNVYSLPKETIPNAIQSPVSLQQNNIFDMADNIL
eukprot:Pgem_evm1s18357